MSETTLSVADLIRMLLMISDNDIIGLKQAYDLFQSLEIIHQYGPLRAYAKHDVVQRLWRSTIDPAVAFVHGNSRKTGDASYVVDAPSPWHAYFYLRAQQQYVYRAGRPLAEAPSRGSPAGGEHLFFRGQRCASWEFKSSLRRKDEATQAIEQRAVTGLAEYFRSTFVADVDIANNTARCFAQHYGIATDLADITCDPDIAVWFATHPVGEPCPSGDVDCVVHAVSWAGQQQGAQTIILLPPPFVRNVYEQRGLFLDTSPTGGVLKGKLTLEVRFPRETAGEEFKVLRAGRPLEVWPEPDDSEKELVRWARQVGAECADHDAVRNTVQMKRSENSLPKFWLERELYDFKKYITAWLSILDWVLPATCVTAISVAPGGLEPIRYEVLDLKVRALVRANPTFFKAFVEASEGADFSGFEVLRQVLIIARNELGV